MLKRIKGVKQMRCLGQREKRSGTGGGRWVFLRRFLGYGVLLLILLMVGVLTAEETPDIDNESAVPQFLEQTLGMEHDELIMLIISLVVVIEVATNLGFLQPIPYHRLLLYSFGSVVLGAFFAVTEGFLFEAALNYLEHFLYMAGAILLAIWCGRVFGFEKKERA